MSFNFRESFLKKKYFDCETFFLFIENLFIVHLSGSKRSQYTITICWRIQMSVITSAHIVRKHLKHRCNYLATKIVTQNHSPARNAIAHSDRCMRFERIWKAINGQIIIWNTFVIFAAQNMHADLHSTITSRSNTRTFSWLLLTWVWNLR